MGAERSDRSGPFFAGWHDLRPHINAIGLLANLACGQGKPKARRQIPEQLAFYRSRNGVDDGRYSRDLPAKIALADQR